MPVVATSSLHSESGSQAAAGIPRLLLAIAFRPFFLLAAAWSALAMLLWLASLTGWLSLPALTPAWHAHELLFGVVAAAAAGFALTAVATWTGKPPLAGAGLLALLLLWLAGRLTMLVESPPGVVAAVTNLLFLPAVALYLFSRLVPVGQRRNYPLVLILLLLTVAQGAWHFMDSDRLLAYEAGLLAVAAMISLIAGRITPAFTRNWLTRNGDDAAVVRSWPVVERTTMLSTLLVLLMLVAGAPMAWTAMAALLAAVANGVRLLGWAGWTVRADPLMWILHLGYAWIPVGLLLLGLFPWIDTITSSAWLHALGTGAMGILILGVMTRVCLGHTGRPLKLPAAVVPAYWLIIVATLLRVAAAMALLPYRPAVIAAGLAWMAAFAIFAIAYWPILTRPRADGRPG